MLIKEGYFRRGLTHLPLLVEENQLRLLSLQHNLLTKLDGLQNLGVNKLVFLDIYDNQLERLSHLDSFENLRVLLVGKNRLKRIDGLRNLTRLEVLDLHGNQITQVSGLGTLRQLKVLNLAGNQLRVIGPNDLDGLVSLQELNLRRNRLKKLLGFAVTQQLHKLYLSNNEILTIEDMWSVGKAAQLKEVSIDSNPVASRADCVSFLVSYLPNLGVLSHMQITEQVRKTAAAWRTSRDAALKNSDSIAEVKRAEVISNARTNWELLRVLPIAHMASTLNSDRKLETPERNENQSVRSSSRESKKATLSHRSFSEETLDCTEAVDYFKLPPILTDEMTKSSGSSNEPLPDSSISSAVSDSTSGHATDTSEHEQERPEKTPSQQKKQLLTKRDRPTTGKSKAKPLQMPSKVREQGGDYLIEICGRCLNVYGQGALRFIDRPWNPAKAVDVTTVKFNYVNFTGVSTVLGRLKQRFPNIEHLIFRETNINCLGQLNALADVQGFTSLQIDSEGNPICQKEWQSYAIYRLAHWGLKTINGKDVTEEEISAASEEYQGLRDLVLWCLPDSLLQPLLNRLRIDSGRNQQSARQWLWTADAALRSVVAKEALQWRRGTLTQDDVLWRHKGRLHLGHLIDLTCSSAEKLQMLEQEWPSILNQLIRDTLVDYSHIDSYMKRCMQDL